MPSGRAVAILAFMTAAYFAIGVIFYDPMAWETGSFNAQAITVFTISWLVVTLIGGWALGPWGGASFGVVVALLQFPIAYVASGEIAPDDTLYWVPIYAIASALFGWLAGALTRASNALAQSEAMFRLFAETVQVGVWIWPTRPGEKPYFNPAAVAILGQGPGEDWRARILQEDIPVAEESERRLLAGEPTRIEYRIRHGGGVRWVRGDSFPVREADGRTRAFVGIVEDVTAEKEREERRELMERRERLSALGTLVAGVAHEVNNPLTYLKGNMELAQMELEKQGASDPHAARAKKLLATSVEGAERISRIVKALRAVTRHSSAGEREPVRLNAVAQNVHELMRTSLPATLHLELALSKDDPVIEGNTGELYQVLLNLAQNAVQAIGPRPGRVVIMTTRAEGDGVIAVRDDGPGIPAEVRARLFTPFYTTKTEGTGLGLSLAHAIVHDHGGDIEVESRAGEGATFRVRLPLLQQPVQQVAG